MSIRILIADDERLVRAGLRMILSVEADLEVVGEAADGREAVLAAGRLHPHVVLMDVRMPVMDGLEATRRLLVRHPDDTSRALRVIILTTFELDEYVYEALRIGASAFLRKDAPEVDLITAIRVAADGGSLFSPSVTARLVQLFAGRRQPMDPPPAIDDLTPRELEVFGLIAAGLPNGEIGDRLGVSEHTAKTHVGHVLAKLDLRDRIQAVILAYEAGADRPLAGTPHDGGRTTRLGSVDRLVGESVRDRVLGAGHVRRRPPGERAKGPARLRPERDELRVLDPPATSELLNDELRVEQQVDLFRPQFRGQGERPHGRRVFGHIVRLDAQVIGDRGVGRRARITCIGAGQIVQGRPGRRRTGVAASGPIGPDQEPGDRMTGASGVRGCPGWLQEHRLGHSGARSGGASRPWSTGNSTRLPDPLSPSLPRSLRHAHWSGS